VLVCHFATKSFELQAGKWAVPCQTRYHAQCFRLSAPFTTRLSKNGGLGFTKGLASVIPLFVCECCTVRKVLQRELQRTTTDAGLLAMERMRTIDMVHNWAPSTLGNYKGRLRQIRAFGQQYKCPVLPVPQLTAPPISDAIPLMWSQQHYSLQARQRERFEELPDDDNGRVGFGSIRHLRSAAALHHSWITMIENPGRVILDQQSKPIAVTACRVTDDISYKLMNTGMSRRLGDKPRQAAPLLDRHIRWMDNHFDSVYRKAIKRGNIDGARESATAAMCNLTAWLGWLRGGENFGINWDDLEVIFPQDSSSRDLPTGVGAILFRLLEQTKTDRTKAADVPIAFHTISGLCPGKWLFRLRKCTDPATMDPDMWQHDTSPLFRHADGRRWTSTYYRQTYLIPLLHQQRTEGDKYLGQFKNLADAFWSLHCYRSGGRSHVSVKRPLCWRKADNSEVNEHGRWRKKKENESMAERYRQWTLRDRLMVTYLCM
jgi:hypothetical protein